MASTTAEPIRTGRSMRAAKPGFLLRTSIPMTTGIRTIANTLTTSANGTDTESPRS